MQARTIFLSASLLATTLFFSNPLPTSTLSSQLPTPLLRTEARTQAALPSIATNIEPILKTIAASTFGGVTNQTPPKMDKDDTGDKTSDQPGLNAPPPKPVSITYQVKRGDTLQLIATRNQKTVQQLVQLNHLKSANTIYIGQVLQIGVTTVKSQPKPAAPKPIIVHPGPSDWLLPDSEIVYGPAYKNFDVAAVAKKYGGYLLDYREYYGGKLYTGPQIIQELSEQFSVGPRVLLAELELQSGWVTQRTADVINNPYPMGYFQPGWEGLYHQMFWAAERINAAFYLHTQGQLDTLILFSGDEIQIAPNLNSGTVAVQNLIARSETWDKFDEQVNNGDFIATYKQLFGDPQKLAVTPLVPTNLTQPQFRLPWEDGQTWRITGGPHNGWAPGSAWAAVDFAPPDGKACRPAAEWDIAVAPGKIIAADAGRVIEDLDGDGFQGTGWDILYMHVAAKGRVAVGTYVNAGDRIGHPSCEGGIATGTHLHLARFYNGVWIRAADPQAPMRLGDWTIRGSDNMYDGYAVDGSDKREACGCYDLSVNGITAEPEFTSLADNRVIRSANAEARTSHSNSNY